MFGDQCIGSVRCGEQRIFAHAVNKAMSTTVTVGKRQGKRISNGGSARLNNKIQVARRIAR